MKHRDIIEVREKRWLGVDESNNGGIPPVYVGVSSNLRSAAQPILPSSDPLGKYGHLKGSEINLMKLIDFRFIIFGDDFCNLFHVNHLKCIALFELYKAHHNIEEILLDGELRSNERNKITHIMGKCLLGNQLRSPTISAIPQGDQTIPIINVADIIARLIYRQGVNKKEPVYRFEKREGVIYTGPFPERRIQPNLDYYFRVLPHKT